MPRGEVARNDREIPTATPTPRPRRAAKPKKPKLAELALVAETLSAASPSRELCVATCGLFRTCQTPFLKPYVPKGWHDGPRLLLVGEAPGQDEDEHSGRPFTGAAGTLLRRLWRRAGYRDEHVALANANRCRPPKNREPKMREIRACRPFLLRTIEVLQPRIVIALGRTALRALTNAGGDQNIVKNRGRRLAVPGYAGGAAVYVTYHPASILHGNTHHEAFIVEDLKRAGRPPTDAPEQPAPRGADVVAVDTEWAPNGDLLTVAVATPSAATVVEGPALPETTRELVGSACVLVGHNLPPDLDQLVKLGAARREWVEGRQVRDTLLLARMHDENRGKGAYDLESLAVTELNARPWKAPTVKLGADASAWPPELRRDRCRRDAWASAALYAHYAANPGGDLTDTPLVEFTHRTQATLHRIHLAGAVVDMRELSRRGDELRLVVTRERDLLTRIALREGMAEFVPTNDGHVRELLYGRLGLPVLRRTVKESLPAVDKITLGQLREHEAVGHLLEFNRADKLLSSWYGGTDRKSKNPPLVELIQPLGELDGLPLGLLRPRINALGARTGRRASDAPNFQNWPKSVRSIIRSRYRGGLIGDHDYASLEVVLMAYMAGDETLFEYFTTGKKYIGVAKDLFGKEVEKDTDDYRVAKSLVLGIDYNMGVGKLAEDLWYRANVRLSRSWRSHVRQAAELRELYFKRFPRVKRYILARRAELLAHGQVVSLTGRVRHLPCPDGEATPNFKRLWNQAVNFPIQSLASDITGSALVDVEQALLREYGLTTLEFHELLLHAHPLELGMSVLINEVHDDLVVDYHPDYVKRDQELVVETMRAVPTLRALVPEFTLALGVEPKLAPAWAA